MECPCTTLGPHQIAQSGLETSFRELKQFASLNFSLGEHSFINVICPRMNKNGLNILMGKMHIPPKALEDIEQEETASCQE